MWVEGVCAYLFLFWHTFPYNTYILYFIFCHPCHCQRFKYFRSFIIPEILSEVFTSKTTMLYFPAAKWYYTRHNLNIRLTAVTVITKQHLQFYIATYLLMFILFLILTRNIIYYIIFILFVLIDFWFLCMCVVGVSQLVFGSVWLCRCCWETLLL